MIGENGHLNRTMKGCANLLLTCTLSFHITIALTLIHISIQNRTQLSQSQRRCKRSILLTSISLIKGWLQEFCHMTIYRFFCKLLHVAVDCRCNLQTIGINIIRRTIFLEILVTPTIQGVTNPGYRVQSILHLIPRWIVRPIRFFGHHILTKELSEICCLPILMINSTKV